MVPLVLVPGIQGRCEYMQPAIDALSASFRVRTFSLHDDARSLDDYARQITETMDAAALETSVICGVSFGGLVALRFAATAPQRTHALVLASTPAPGWKLRPRHRLYTRVPWLFGPLFLMETPWRLRAELVTAFPNRRHRTAFCLTALRTLRTAPISLSQMARRAELMTGLNVVADCARVTAPTLVVTGEPALDHVVPVDGSMAYARLIGGARETVIEGTGHLGTITRPQVFAERVRKFVEDLRHAAA